MEILRSEDGCPWDREQTHQSIRRDLIEETYEVIEAIDRDSEVMLCEELGDLLLQVVFHARIAEEAGRFSLDEVADGICKKLILRHPHIFGDVKVDSTEQVLTNWDAIKKVEKSQESDRAVLDAVSHALPSLIRADKLIKKAGKMGITVGPELTLPDAAPGTDEASKQIGELLLSAVSLARQYGVEPEKALQDACDALVLRAKD